LRNKIQKKETPNLCIDEAYEEDCNHTMQMTFQCPQRQIFIHKKALVPLGTVADQIDKIRMMQKAKQKAIAGILD
jgi:hypothetical protein